MLKSKFPSWKKTSFIKNKLTKFRVNQIYLATLEPLITLDV